MVNEASTTTTVQSNKRIYVKKLLDRIDADVGDTVKVIIKKVE